MSKKILIIGHGSIGKRHYDILSDFSLTEELRVVSSQSNLPQKSFKSLNDARKFNPDYVVIASETHKHYDHLEYVLRNFSTQNILVEKPLFEEYKLIDADEKSIYVGYNLRFHPHIKKLKELISDQTVRSVYASCHSYLPEWRKNKSYKDSYSASKEKGGGVLLDLSHEIDLLLWLFGEIEIDFVKHGKHSDLSIETEDSFLLSGHSDNRVNVELSLSYFSPLAKRELHVVTDEESILIDLMTNTMTLKKVGCKSNIETLKAFERNSTYISQHKEILSSSTHNACTYPEGLLVNKFIDELKVWKKN